MLAWYSLIHLAASELPAAVGALARLARARRLAGAGAARRAEVRHSDEWFGDEVDLDFVWHDPAHVRRVVADAGLTVAEWYLRGPVAERGETTDRF